MLLSLISQRAALLTAGAVFISQPCRDNSAADNQSFAMSVNDDGGSIADPVLVGAGDIASCGGNSEVRNNTTYGVIRLALHDRGYDWRFVPVRGGRFTDAGTGRCH